MENSELKYEGLKNSVDKLYNLALILKEVGEQERLRVTADELLLRAIFDVLSVEQKEKVLSDLEFKTSPISGVVASHLAESSEHLFRLLPELLARSQLN